MNLEVPRARVKTIKDALKAHSLLDKSIQITPLHSGECFSIPIKALHGVRLNDQNEPYETALFQLLSLIGMERYAGDLKLSFSTRDNCEEKSSPNRIPAFTTGNSTKGSPLGAAIDAWLESIPAPMTLKHANRDGSKSTHVGLEIHSSKRMSAYTVYPPMLLLPPSALSNYVLDKEISKHLPKLYECICKFLKVTHIALNAPIPSSTLTKDSNASPNIMRSPTWLTPLHGNFGPSLPVGHIPTTSDFEAAFWCTTRQNGIFQTWAPRYTMFSRGNISEKTRILDFATPDRERDLGRTRNNYKAKDSMAVDLYAGIGYFAFSFAKAGVDKVLCWEINPWSVEGLKRGANGNNWRTLTVGENGGPETLSQRIREEQPRFIIFQENNENATKRIQVMLSGLDPLFPYLAAIRHVNCGYLPSSRESWETAVNVLDKQQGGWIHVHENIDKLEIDARRAEIVDVFKNLTNGKFGQMDDLNTSDVCVSCEHLEHVKSYAPGIIHCVLDISVIISYK